MMIRTGNNTRKLRCLETDSNKENGPYYNDGLLGENVRVLQHLHGRVKFTEYSNAFPEQTTLRQFYSIHPTTFQIALIMIVKQHSDYNILYKPQIFQVTSL